MSDSHTTMWTDFCRGTTLSFVSVTLQGRRAPVGAGGAGGAEPQRELSSAGRGPGVAVAPHMPRLAGPVLHQCAPLRLLGHHNSALEETRAVTTQLVLSCHYRYIALHTGSLRLYLLFWPLESPASATAAPAPPLCNGCTEFSPPATRLTPADTE